MPTNIKTVRKALTVPSFWHAGVLHQPNVVMPQSMEPTKTMLYVNYITHTHTYTQTIH